jgi:hypothetical protein
MSDVLTPPQRVVADRVLAEEQERRRHVVDARRSLLVRML